MSAETCSYEFWLGPRELKYSSSGVERSVKRTPRSAARAVLDTIGVTKVADVTDLDRVGIPHFMTVRRMIAGQASPTIAARERRAPMPMRAP
jgi:hypothetical protein